MFMLFSSLSLGMVLSESLSELSFLCIKLQSWYNKIRETFKMYAFISGSLLYYVKTN